MLIVTLGVGISCLSRKSREWREYTLEDLDEWYYSKYPEKKRAQNLDPKSRMYIDPNGYRLQTSNELGPYVVLVTVVDATDVTQYYNWIHAGRRTIAYDRTYSRGRGPISSLSLLAVQLKWSGVYVQLWKVVYQTSHYYERGCEQWQTETWFLESS
jgi:hypothetical protein